MFYSNKIIFFIRQIKKKSLVHFMWAPVNFPPWRVSYVDISTQSSHLGEDRWSHSHPLAEVVSVCLQTNSQAVYLWWQCDPTSVCTSYSADFSWVSVSEITKKLNTRILGVPYPCYPLVCNAAPSACISFLCSRHRHILPIYGLNGLVWFVATHFGLLGISLCYKKQKYRK